ncbi:autoinducer binding domain-containing protein [Burkholderia guangdongensis]|uniref:autoinducer binding domain-containing protein n=1 Tax=Burkholderia guangdongensis TaxID=1792500 RepID=UPI0015CC0B62|nr:autoinducer binding domain-containing protein [Burkholderia guangdongensis]
MEVRWQDVYHQLNAAGDEQQLFRLIAACAKQLGFDYCCYGIRMPLPLSKPAVAVFDTYPDGWIEHYHRQNYVDVDSTVRDGAVCRDLIVWPDIDDVRSPFWEDARDHGLVFGAAQSSWGPHGELGLLSFARSAERLSRAETDWLRPNALWLANLSHTLMSGFVVPKLAPEVNAVLTVRERDVLRWTAEGKTACEIGEILGIAERTVNFHIRNIFEKLGATNKVQAVVKAMSAGLLDTR